METDFQHKRIGELIAKQLCSELDEREVQELEAWLQERPENRAFYQRVTDQAFIRQKMAEREAIDMVAYSRAFEKAIGSESRRRARRYGYWAAAGVVLLILGIALFPRQHAPSLPDPVKVAILPGGTKALLVQSDGQRISLTKDTVFTRLKRGVEVLIADTVREPEAVLEEQTHAVIVPVGGEYHLELSDGTQVYLNSESEIRFPDDFVGKERVVTLTGEAYFRVAADMAHPFIVRTAGMDVRVTGTEFNLRAYPDEHCLQATLVKGSVSVFTGKERETGTMLLPSQQAEWNRETASLQVKEVDASFFTAWKNGQFIFRQERLEEIMRTLARWYNVEVVYKDDALKDLCFGGKLDRSKDIMPILSVIRATDKVTIQVEGRKIVFGVK